MLNQPSLLPTCHLCRTQVAFRSLQSSAVEAAAIAQVCAQCGCTLGWHTVVHPHGLTPEYATRVGASCEAFLPTRLAPLLGWRDHRVPCRRPECDQLTDAPSGFCSDRCWRRATEVREGQP